METKTCQNCKQDFIIEPDDFSFYQKIKVPPPTFCPECRLQRRFTWRNDLSFYNRTCDMCNRDIISLYHKDKPLTVYCNKCWWGDVWDPKLYGKDIDFSRPFFEQFRELQDKVPLLSMFNDNGVGSTNSEYAQNATFIKNCYMGAITWFAEDCMYFYNNAGPETRDVVDSVDIFNYSQIIYDSIFLEHCYNCRNCYYSTGLNDCMFCYDCKGCSDCFMCVNLRQKKYCIFNKQYSKEEYFKLRDKLIEHMKKTGEYGEFFPAEMSNFGYNETMAQEYFPLTKEEAIKRGYKWWDDIQKTTGKETFKTEELPDSILDVSENILNEILACEDCDRNYKIVQDEFLFYKKHLIPIPRRCFYCRNGERLKFENPSKLWARTCMCEKENHFHGKDKCQVGFETPYAPERPEIIYCEKCYQQEVY